MKTELRRLSALLETADAEIGRLQVTVKAQLAQMMRDVDRAEKAEAEVERLRAERRGEIDANLGHPDWETASHKDVLDALRFQGATTKALIKELDEMRSERNALRANIETMRQAALIDDWHTFDAAIDAARRER